MKQLVRRLSRVADSSSATSYFLLRSTSSDRFSSTSSSKRSSWRNRRRSRSVPSGHLPVYVGDEMERFVVSADLLNHPIFVNLLNRSAQEYGYEQKGALRIPCSVPVFECVLDALDRGQVSREVYDLVNSLEAGSSSSEILIVDDDEL